MHRSQLLVVDAIYMPQLQAVQTDCLVHFPCFPHDYGLGIVIPLGQKPTLVSMFAAARPAVAPLYLSASVGYMTELIAPETDRPLRTIFCGMVLREAVQTESSLIRAMRRIVPKLLASEATNVGFEISILTLLFLPCWFLAFMGVRNRLIL